MCKIVFILCSILGCTYSASTYDQRQTGDLNVQVDLKDLQIIALIKGNKEEYVDYDYAYDYSEMTIKPQNGTTQKPLNVTSPATEPDKTRNNTTVASNTVEQTTLIAKDNNSLVTWYPAVNESTTLPTTAKGSETASSGQIAHMATTTAAVESTCKKGFVLNQKGDCEIKLQSPGNALLKLVKLSQKLKLRRENRKGSRNPE